MKGMATIQVQDVSGNWRSTMFVIKQDQVIKVNIDSVARQFKNRAGSQVERNKAKPLRVE